MAAFLDDDDVAELLLFLPCCRGVVFQSGKCFCSPAAP
jgi:hypothetical protein